MTIHYDAFAPEIIAWIFRSARDGYSRARGISRLISGASIVPASQISCPPVPASRRSKRWCDRRRGNWGRRGIGPNRAPADRRMSAFVDIEGMEWRRRLTSRKWMAPNADIEFREVSSRIVKTSISSSRYIKNRPRLSRREASAPMHRTSLSATCDAPKPEHRSSCDFDRNAYLDGRDPRRDSLARTVSAAVATSRAVGLLGRRVRPCGPSCGP